jgi:hypothetical protein
MSLRSQFGKPKTSGNTGPKIFRLKGEKATAPEIYRLIPPIKSCAESGKWAVYHAQHFGYQVPDRNDASKLQIRTFACIQKKDRSGLITVECPECNLIAEKKAQLEATTADLKRAGHSDAEIASITEPLKDWLKNHNVDGKWYIGVKGLSGEYGALAIPHKMKMALDAEIKRLKDKEDIDAFDLDTGVWFHFKRSGLRVSDMNFTVETVMEDEVINGRKVKSIKPAPLSDDELGQILESVPDLNAEIVRAIGLEKITALVESGGDPEEVSRILADGAAPAAPAPKPIAPKPIVAAPAPVAKPTPKPVEAPVFTADDEDEEAAMMRKLAEIRAKKSASAAAPPPADNSDLEFPPKAPAPAPKPVATPKPAAPAVSMDNMSDEDFMAMFNS